VGILHRTHEKQAKDKTVRIIYEAIRPHREPRFLRKPWCEPFSGIRIPLTAPLVPLQLRPLPLAGMYEPARLQPLTEAIRPECGSVAVLLVSSLRGRLKSPLPLAHIALAPLSFMPLRALVQ